MPISKPVEEFDIRKCRSHQMNRCFVCCSIFDLSAEPVDVQSLFDRKEMPRTRCSKSLDE